MPTCETCENWKPENYKYESCGVNYSSCNILDQFDQGCGGNAIICPPEDFGCNKYQPVQNGGE